MVTKHPQEVEEALKLNAKVSQRLYRGYTNLMKKQIQSEISRGLLQGASYAEIARNLHNTTNASFNNTMRIVRTEGHRIQVQSAVDACHKAKNAGADIIKQWDATLDGATRDTHRELDGEIAELDEDFEYSGGSVLAPGMFGDPAEDCNCRCCILQRARWALDKSELKELESRAAYYGLDKVKDFNEYKEKYLGVVKAEDSDIIKAEERFRKADDARADLKFITDEIFDKLTIEARKNGAGILRETKEVEEHLDKMEVAASNIGDVLFFRKDVCISEVLEETYHFKQNKLKLNADKDDKLRTILNEIDAKQYLLDNANKYKIPRKEIEITEKQLESYKEQLKKYQ